MKSLIKRAVRPFWRLTSVVRRPFARKLDQRLSLLMAAAVREQVLPSVEASNRTLDRLEHSLQAANHSAFAVASDMDLLLSSLVREVARLQGQVESLGDLIEARSYEGRGGLSIVDESAQGVDSIAWQAPIDRARVG